MNPDEIPLEDWVTVDDLVRLNPGVLTAGAVGWQIRNRRRNGLASAVARIGRQLRVSKTLYARWLARQAGGPNDGRP